MPDRVRVVVHHGGRELTGVARPGEPWARAADRVAATVAGSPVPLDLAGATKEFVVDPDLRVALRAMTHADLPDLVRWRSAEHVHRWFASDGDATEEAVRSTYGPRIDGMTPTRMWVVEANGRSVGFLQDYLISDHPEFALLTPDPEAMGLDYAIGEGAWLGKGVGVRMLWAWMLATRHRRPEVTSYFAAPDHRNAASLRALAKAGFTEGTWFDEPQSDGSTATMVGCTLDVEAVLG